MPKEKSKKAKNEAITKSEQKEIELRVLAYKLGCQANENRMQEDVLQKIESDTKFEKELVEIVGKKHSGDSTLAPICGLALALLRNFNKGKKGFDERVYVSDISSFRASYPGSKIATDNLLKLLKYQRENIPLFVEQLELTFAQQFIQAEQYR